MTWLEAHTIVIEDGVIVDLESGNSARADIEIDAADGFVMPGFIDAHVHFRLASLNFRKLAAWTEVQFGIAMAGLCGGHLQRGFTTVRDTGGDLGGLLRAIAEGAVAAPRIVHSGLMISQTGGHGDAEGGPRAVPDCACQMRHTAMGIVADGADAVRKAARHVLRAGADFLKSHVSGGVASPSDPLECTQYTADEIRAAVVEAEHRNTYVTAHAYTPAAIQLAIENGVRCIEHGNLLDTATARLMADQEITLVPTLVTYAAMRDAGAQLGLPMKNQQKNTTVLDAGLHSLEIARDAGVVMGWGTDLIGETQVRQAEEFALRAEVLSAREILHSMYVVNPALLGMADRIGAIRPGMYGDLVITPVDALANIKALGDSRQSIQTVVVAGKPGAPA